jgi:ATP-dependent Zn protease
VLVANTKSLDALAAALLENETLEEEAVAEILKDSTLPKEAALY